MFQVLQDGKPCREYTISGWDIDTFETKKEAEIFAHLWAYPIDKETAKEWSDKRGEMELNKEYDMSMGGPDCPVMMKIVEIHSLQPEK